MKASLISRSLLVGLAALAAACTMKKQEAPDFSGPSELSTSLTISVSPDVLQQDGASQSVITVMARGPNGQPLSNVSLRAEIRVNGTPTDFGSLSARTAVTGGDGRATLVYTAPQGLSFSVDEFTIVDIGITPVGSDFNNSTTRFASLRLVPRGVVLPPAGLQPSFTFSPTSPTDNQDILFDASASQSPANNPIAAYEWNFGNGDRTSGRSVTYSYDQPGTYVVTLTISDGVGRSASTSRSLTVAPGVNPTASFAFSPEAPEPGRQVNFNAAESRPAPGRDIVRYVWDFGDGTAAGSGRQVSHTYPTAGAYVVILTVTDDVGRTGTVKQTVVVAVPEEEDGSL